MFKCPQCRTNNHALSTFPLMKNWSIKKKIKPDTINDTNAPGTDRSDVEFDLLTSHDSQYVTTGGTSHDAILSGIYYL